jgi:hypothetical protein
VRRIRRNALLLLVLFIALGTIFCGWAMGLSILLGGALSFLSMHWLTATVDRLLLNQGTQGIPSALLRYLGRLVLILAVFFAMIHSSFLDVLGTLLGLSVFVLSGMLEAVLLLFKADAR